MHNGAGRLTDGKDNAECSAIAAFPEALGFLFEPTRYKVAYGGRGSGKSWGFARALLIQGVHAPLRILCAREVQKSVKESVHRLLNDQIKALGLGSYYRVLESTIRGTRNDTAFVFAGLASHTVDSIKSYEGIDRVWVEEGQTVSKRSWDILTPTIRKPGSEIWVTLNPELDSDEAYQRFVVNPPPNAIVRKVNYVDNPWFPDVLEEERRHCWLTNREDYATIWEGRCRAAAKGAIYAGEMEAAQSQGRICGVPHDATLPVHCIWDLGWNDAMTIILAQRVGAELRIVDYIEESHRTLDWYVGELKRRPYLYGTDWLPHDGEHKDFKTGRSTRDILTALGRTVQIVPNVPVNEGIRTARMTLPRVYFEREKAARLVECLKRYRRAINTRTNEPGEPLHDEYSHGADAFRYLCLIAGRMHGAAIRRPRPPRPPPHWRAM